MATGRRLLIICLLAFLAREASCQTLESLREDIKRAEREISITNDLLSKTRKNQQSADKELKLIRNKIRNRRNIISNLEQQAGLLNRNIDEKGSTIASLEQDLARLRKEYGEMVYSAYKNYKLNSFLVFLFSSIWSGIPPSNRFTVSYLRTDGRKIFTRMILDKICSRCIPSFSYMANKNAGSIKITMPVAALLVPSVFLVRK